MLKHYHTFANKEKPLLFLRLFPATRLAVQAERREVRTEEGWVMISTSILFASQRKREREKSTEDYPFLSSLSSLAGVMIIVGRKTDTELSEWETGSTTSLEKTKLLSA